MHANVVIKQVNVKIRKVFKKKIKFTKGSFCFNIFTTRVISVEVVWPPVPPDVTVGELLEGFAAVLVVGGVGVVAVVTVVGVVGGGVAEARLEALPEVEDGRSFVHISATHCDHGSEDCA